MAISMDSRGGALDNVLIERLWRSVKYEEVSLKDYADGWVTEEQLQRSFAFYCHERIPQSLGYQTPAVVYATTRGRRAAAGRLGQTKTVDYRARPGCMYGTRTPELIQTGAAAAPADHD